MKEDAGTRQQIIMKLATDEGLGMIKDLTDTMSDSQTEKKTVDVFNNRTLPFFQTISHPDVLSSLILETPLETILNFLFGPNGRRAVPVFRYTATALSTITLDNSLEDEDLSRVSFTVSIEVLQRIIDLNQTAQVISEFSPIVETISACIPEHLPLHSARQNLSRIRQRLGLGAAMASLGGDSRTDPQSVRAVFELKVDMPGSLSEYGSRHDNDHQNIRDIKILPTAQEIQSDRREYLPSNDLTKNHLPGLEGLIDRHFRLLREDTVGQLRDAVRLELERLHSSPNAQFSSERQSRVARNIVYHNAQLVGLRFDRKKGLQIVAEFDQPHCLRNMKPPQREEWWKSNKHLRLDALVCLVSSTGRTIFFSVCDPVPTPPRKSQTPEDEELQTPSDALSWRKNDEPSLFRHEKKASMVLSMVEENAENVTWINSRLKSDRKLQQSFVEFPGILLPSFRPTLLALQRMSRKLDLPFANLIVPSTVNEETNQPPAYSQTRRFAFNLESLTGGVPLQLKPGTPFDYETLRKASTLDDAQQISVVNALSSGLALIQGPPGTGKSYTGVAIIKALLHNRREANLGPIVCVCYTNHALDQLLEHLIRDGVSQVVRVGSRSKSRLLEKLNLYYLSQQIEQTKTEKYEKWQHYETLDHDLEAIKEILQELENPTSWKSIKSYLENQFPNRHYQELFGKGVDEDGFRTVRDKRFSVVTSWLRGAPKNASSNRPVIELSQIPLLEMSASERRALHAHWVKQRSNELNDHLLRTLESYGKRKVELDKCYQELNLRCLLQAHVIGVTTTGLARNLEVLSRLRAKVMVCEEAGEVLEAHTLTALLPSVQHAILIGDHEQLRPQINNYELQHDHPTGAKYSLDISLFERLVNPQPGYSKMPYSSLKTQRRMHPSIAELVRSTLYPNLQDHTSVLNYPEVDGIRDRLFWLDHQEHEDSTTSSSAVSFSKTNSFEVELVAALVSHLIRQGTYGNGDIAVLTPYLGQLQKIKQRLRSSFEIVVNDRDQADLEVEGLEDDPAEVVNNGRVKAQKTTLLNALRVATVDNFQGEEAKVIIISLVRSNNERRCGFLKTSNRINVLLSRARHGMYIIGNSETASSVLMWADVISILERGGHKGPKLALCCPRHKDTPIEVSSPDDFTLFSPEGGCNQKCTSRLKCGHACINKCHSQPLHDAVRCLQRCQRNKKGCEHACPKPCGDPCEENCHVQLSNVALPCGHVRKWLECHKAQAPDTVQCQTRVDVVVPGCKHKVRVRCCELPLKGDYQCPATCGADLVCGHNCKKTCKDCKPKTEETSEIVHGECKAQCGRPYTTCSHACTKTCHGTAPCQLCDAACEVRCSHSRCSKKCNEPCMPCVEDCSWSCPHRGKCKLPCAVPCDLLPCSERCPKLLSCGHRCPSVCGEVCPGIQYCQQCARPAVKEMMVDYIMTYTYAEVNLDVNPCIIPSCGHIITLESLDGHLSFSNYYVFSKDPSSEGLIVGLQSSSEPFSGEGLKHCPMCRGPLRNINRYGRIVRRAWIDEATKKFIVWANTNFVPLAKRMEVVEKRFRERSDDKARTDPVVISIPEETKLDGSRDQQITKIYKLLGRSTIFKNIMQLRVEIKQFLKKVDEAEQPFTRIHDLVKDARRHRGVDTEIFSRPDVLQVRNRILATVLLLRCDFAILAEFLASLRGTPSEERIRIDLKANRNDCMALINESQERKQPQNRVEGLLYWARFVALERTRSKNRLEDVSELLTRARDYLQVAKEVCKSHPGQTPGLLSEVEDAEKMLRESTFYTPVGNAEKAAVYAAMARDFSGTGHWYYCANGHPFTVGECGMPMQTSQCPQCGSPVGGRDHQAVVGVTRAADFEEQFGRMRI